MSSSSRSRSSISKQRGAEMSSRLMPPNTGAIALTVATISSGSVVARQIGKASTPPNSLNSIALPSITGKRAFRADVPESENSRAVADHGDRVLLDRQVPDLRRVLGDRRRHTGDAGRVRHREVVPRFQRRLQRDLDLAPEVHQEGPVGHVDELDPGDLLYGGGDLLQMLGVAGEHRHVADLRARLGADEVDRAEQAAGLADRVGEPAERPRPVFEPDPQCRAEGGGRMQGGHQGPAGSAVRTSSSRRTGKSSETATRQPRSAASPPRPLRPRSRARCRPRVDDDLGEAEAAVVALGHVAARADLEPGADVTPLGDREQRHGEAEATEATSRSSGSRRPRRRP